MFYERKLKYLEYWKNGEKIRSVGFVKIEVMDAECKIQINLNGFPLKERLIREIKILGGGRESVLGNIVLEDGRGSLELRRQDARNLGTAGLPYSELERILIVIGTGKELVCGWKEQKKDAGKLPERDKAGGKLREGNAAEGQFPGENLKSEGLPEEGTEIAAAEGEMLPQKRQLAESCETAAGETTRKAWSEEKTRESSRRESPQENQGKEGYQKDVQAAELVPVFSRQTRAEEEKLPETQPDAPVRPMSAVSAPGPVSQTKPARSARLRLYEDKWQQLSSIYPHIRPFEDERDYLSITPADFVVLQKQYHRLVSNSFLLHGYYNYEHLILARMNRMGAIRYYVGVPGNFYEKERQVAIMFGFESFECKKEPAEQGDFGYYCIRVDL